MKKKLSISFIIIGFVFISISLVRSFFYPTAIYTGIKFMVGDFVSPSVITLSNEVLYTNDQEYLFSWEESFDFKNLSKPVYYRFSINGREYRSDFNQINLNLDDYLEGQYLFRVRVCDFLDNCSQWSNEQSLVIDRIARDFSILVDNFVIREAEFNNLVRFGDGEQNQDYIQIGSNLSLNNWQDNFVQYTVLNNPRLKYFAFNYLTDSDENLKGFDPAKLIITINDKIVFYEDQASNNNEWKKGLVDLSLFNEEELIIKFFSGNFGDNQLSSWSKIRNLTTNFILDTDKDKLIIKEILSNNSLLNITQSITDNRLIIVSSDQAGNSFVKELRIENNFDIKLDLFQLEKSLINLGFVF